MTALFAALVNVMTESALATVEPDASDDLVAARVRGYFHQHWRRLAPFGATRENLRGLAVTVLTVRPSGRRVDIDFTRTPLAGS